MRRNFRMEIYINGNKIDYSPLFPLTWGNFFKKLLENENYIPRDHGIVAIAVDDQDALQVMTEQSENRVPEDIRGIKITTKDSLAITQDGFTKVLAILESIKREILAAADLYREGKINEASLKIVKILEAIKPIANFTNSVGMSFSLNFDQIPFDAHTTLREKVEQFLETIDELVAAQKKQDYVELADYLEYRLVKDMNDWHEIVNLLLQKIEAIHSQNNLDERVNQWLRPNNRQDD